MSKRYFEIKEVQNPSQRSLLLGKVNLARNELLWIFILTLINIALLIFNAGFYMIFSITIPYMIADMGMIFCGKYSAEYYEYYWGEMEFLPKGSFAIFVIISLILASLILLAYIFSKKHKGWLIFGLVYVCIDLLVNFYYYEFSSQTVIDTIFHIIMIVSLARGISAYSKLNALPPEEETDQSASEDETSKPNDSLTNSTPLRMADLNVKSRTFLEYSHNGHRIIYRRVKKTNELIIDNYVYGEYTAWAELSHALTANIDGHTYTVGYNSMTSRSFINLDNVTMLEKTRWI